MIVFADILSHCLSWVTARADICATRGRCVGAPIFHRNKVSAAIMSSPSQIGHTAGRVAAHQLCVLTSPLGWGRRGCAAPVWEGGAV